MNTELNNVLKNVQEASDQTLAAATDLSKLATRTQGLLLNKQIAAFELWLEAGAKQIKSFSEIRDGSELLKTQAEVAQDLGHKLVTSLNEVVEIQTQARDEMAKLVQGNLKQVQAAVKPGKKTTATAKTSVTRKKAA